MRLTIFFYRHNTGKCPVEEFLDSLPPLHAQKVTWVLRLIEDIDRVPSKYLKKLSGSDGLWECRVNIGSVNYRLLGFPLDNAFILVSAFMKKQNRMPIRELKTAQKYRQDYIRRSKNV